MSVDKLVDSTQLDSDLTSVANAIRTKGGTSAQLAFPSGFVSAINAIPTGGTSDWTKVVVSTAATTAKACADSLFANRRDGYVYFAYLDQKETPVTLDYHLEAFCVFRNSTVGGGYRYRTSNSTHNSFSGITTSVTAKIAVGDVFYVCERQYNNVS